LSDSNAIDARILRTAKIDFGTQDLQADEAPMPDMSDDLQEHKLAFELASLHQKILEAQDTHQLRLDYAKKLFSLVCFWLLCVVVAVGLSGFKWCGFQLSESVLIAFITTTTVNVVGLFIVVAKWLFPDVKSKATTP
jgi:hypothetical protein